MTNHVHLLREKRGQGKKGSVLTFQHFL
jgi:hypothetical protein